MGHLCELAILLHQNYYPSTPWSTKVSTVCPFNALPLKTLYTDLGIEPILISNFFTPRTNMPLSDTSQ